MSEVLEEELIKQEGFVEGGLPYSDIGGTTTIGFGYTKYSLDGKDGRPHWSEYWDEEGTSTGKTMSKEEAKELMPKIKQIYSSQADSVLTNENRTQREIDALTNLIYRNGIGNVKNSGVIEAFNSGDLEKAQEIIKNNPNLRKSGGTALQEGDVGYRGITNRNNSIADSLNVTQEQVTEETSTTPDPLEKMFNYVSDKKYYSKTYDEFKEQYSTEEAQEKLYDFVKKKKAYSKSKGEFLNQYFPITDETTEEVETTEEKTTEEAETTEVFESKIGKDQQKAKIKEFNSLDPEQKNAKAEAEGFSNSFEYKQWLMGAERTTKELHGDKGETVVRHSVSKENQVDEGLIDNFITQGNNDVVVDLMTLEERKAEDAARQEISQEDWEATRPEKSTGVEVFEGVGGFITDAISEIGTIISQGYQMTPLGEGEIVRGGGSAKQREKQERESLENAYSNWKNQYNASYTPDNINDQSTIENFVRQRINNQQLKDSDGEIVKGFIKNRNSNTYNADDSQVDQYVNDETIINDYNEKRNKALQNKDARAIKRYFGVEVSDEFLENFDVSKLTSEQQKDPKMLAMMSSLSNLPEQELDIKTGETPEIKDLGEAGIDVDIIDYIFIL